MAATDSADRTRQEQGLVPHLRKNLKQLTSGLRLGLFGRTFLLLAALMLVSLVAWLQVFFSMELGPRANQMAQRVITAVNITRTALIYSQADERSKLLLDLATNEGIQVYPREITDFTQPLPDDDYWQRVAQHIRSRFGAETQIAWSVNQVPGFWVSFRIDQDLYWLVFEREQIGLTGGIEWLGWGATALLLSLVGAAVSVGFVNRPLSRLARAAQVLSRGETPAPLPEQGPREIRDLNASFNRMAKDLRQAEADRELMLAGISHDLRTPLARMRLEIEMSGVTEDARQAIDDDLGQIDHSIGQLMEYARPAGTLPQLATDISSVLSELYERERSHTASLGGELEARIEPGLRARITALDLKRIVGNLIENARRYGRSTDGMAHLVMTVQSEGNMLAIEVSDRGPGIAPEEVERLLRPFSRGEAARTGVSGAGLGLAIVERLLKHVGGSLKMLPRHGGGLIARIELPKVKFRNYQLDTENQ
ncbi:ATP-binding protein [Bordetella avium]|uniref:sensor histidine kinase RisS n=1 Tax=Bordetella avium TaxID=521 RepID=UPI000E0C2475|nr:ATP-binding protein [Bordetella avium]AZY51946.1 two-component sensor histidine kinase [Bordetella avium]RIQ13873.1 HAMP domain-containing protein [Bordetella avium]RIQ17053.1 HAMP domain-containing protein [Bordetella avium]RIQ36221.1 HAMP domain-containing protein [Bordetella avium]RIQ39570.1 HAMP domain-containing protein [Bordetella avium]